MTDGANQSCIQAPGITTPRGVLSLSFILKGSLTFVEWGKHIDPQFMRRRTADDTIDLSGTPESKLAFPAEIQSTTWRVNSRREALRLNTAHAAFPKPA